MNSSSKHTDAYFYILIQNSYFDTKMLYDIVKKKYKKKYFNKDIFFKNDYMKSSSKHTGAYVYLLI